MYKETEECSEKSELCLSQEDLHCQSQVTEMCARVLVVNGWNAKATKGTQLVPIMEDVFTTDHLSSRN